MQGKDFSSDLRYGVMCLTPTELNRGLNVFVEVGFQPDVVLLAEKRTRGVSLRDGMI